MTDSGEQPIPDAWRPMFRAVVSRFVADDYELAAPVPGVAPVDPKVARHARSYVAEYGARLIELPDETWTTSIRHRYGTHWRVLVDLWAEDEGRTDMVLSGQVEETDDGPQFTIHLVYVP